MARTCPICAKGSRLVTNRKLLRGHYNPTTVKRKQPNLQWAVLPSGKRELICASCLKSLHKVAA